MITKADVHTAEHWIEETFKEKDIGMRVSQESMAAILRKFVDEIKLLKGWQE